MQDCLFCKIVRNEIPSEKIYEDDEIMAFKDINPAAPIHFLVVPKKHIQDLLHVEDKDFQLIAKMHKAINYIVKEQGIAPNGFRMIVNCGKDSGQEVMHLHFHILAGKKLGDKIVE